MLKGKSISMEYKFEESRGFPTFVFTGEGSFHITDSLSDERRLICHFCPGRGFAHKLKRNGWCELERATDSTAASQTVGYEGQKLCWL